MSAGVTRVLFVCHANVCRSPLAEAAFRGVVEQAGHASSFEIDSAGTHAIEGARPHEFSVQVGARYGLVVRGRARQLLRRDLDHFHHLLVMDEANLSELRFLAAPGSFGPIEGYSAHIERLRVAAGTAAGRDADVADPIGQDLPAYERMFGLVRAAAQGLFMRLSA